MTRWILPWVAGVACGLGLALPGAVRLLHERNEAVADRDALLAFIRLVVDDVERSVGRAGVVLADAGRYVRACGRSSEGVAYAGGRWWVFDQGYWTPLEAEP